MSLEGRSCYALTVRVAQAQGKLKVPKVITDIIVFDLRPSLHETVAFAHSSSKRELA